MKCPFLIRRTEFVQHSVTRAPPSSSSIPCSPYDEVQSRLMPVWSLDHSGVAEALELGDGVPVSTGLLVIVVGHKSVERTSEIHALSRL